MRARKELFCNACGKKIQMENNILRRMFLKGRKSGDIFPKKMLRCILLLCVKTAMTKWFRLL